MNLTNELNNELNNFDLPTAHQPTPFNTGSDSDWLVEDMANWAAKHNFKHDDVTGSGLERFDCLTSFMNS